MAEKYKFTYFALWARGPAPALALSFAGLDWVGDNAGVETMADYTSEWLGKHKAKAAWNLLPNLDVPSDGLKIGHEGAILNFIGRKVPAMAGESDKDFAASQQLFCVGEDIYIKLVTLCDTAYNAKGKDKEREKFWEMADEMSHNANYGIKVYCKQLENFYKQCGNAVESGKFTSTGTTVGECKLFASVHACVMIKGEDLLKDSPCLLLFYKRFLNEKVTQEIIADGGKYPHAFSQYLVETTKK